MAPALRPRELPESERQEGVDEHERDRESGEPHQSPTEPRHLILAHHLQRPNLDAAQVQPPERDRARVEPGERPSQEPQRHDEHDERQQRVREAPEDPPQGRLLAVFEHRLDDLCAVAGRGQGPAQPEGRRIVVGDRHHDHIAHLDGRERAAVDDAERGGVDLAALGQLPEAG